MKRILVIAGICLIAAPAAAQLSILGLKNSMVQFLLDQLSVEGQFEITAENVEEPEDGATAIVGLTVADSEGIWLRAESLNFNWSPSRLLLGEIEFANLALTGVDVLRQPVPGPAVDDQETEEEVATDGGLGFTIEWPRSPLALKVDRMALERVTLAEDVLGHAISFDATGAARDEGDIQAVRLDITRLDAVEGIINFDYEVKFDEGTLRLNLDAKEGPNGLIAALSGLPPEATTIAVIKADGPPENWKMSLDIDLAEMMAIDGFAALSYSEVLKIDTEIVVEPGPRLDPGLADLIGERSEIRALASESPDGLIVIEEGHVRAPDVDLVASGTFDEPTGRADLKITLDARSGLAGPIDGVDFDGLTFDGTLSGAPGSYAAQGELDLLALATQPVDIADADLTINVVQSTPEGESETTTRFDVGGLTRGLRLDKIGPDVLGDPNISLAGALTGNALTLDGVELTSEVLRFAVAGLVDLDLLDADVSLSLSAPDFGPVAAAYDQDVAGSIAAEGHAVRKDGVLDLTFETGLRSFSHELAEAEALDLALTVRNEDEQTRFDVSGDGTSMRIDKLTPDILGELTLAIKGDLDGSDLTLETARIASIPLTFETAGTADIKTQDADLAFVISAPDMAPVAAAYQQEVAGEIAAEGSLQKTDDVIDLVVVAALANLAHEMADAKVLDLTLTAANRGARTAFIAEGNGEALRLDQIPPELLGIVSFATSGVVEGEALLIESTTLRSDLLEAAVEGNVALSGQAGQIKYNLRTAALGPITTLYDVPLDGRASLSGDVVLAAAGPRVAGNAALEEIVFQGQRYGDLALDHDVTVGETPAGSLAIALRKSPYGTADVATDFTFAAPELTLDGLRVSALGATLAGDLKLDTERTLAEGDLAFRAASLAPVSKLAGTDLAGSLDGNISARRPSGRQSATLRLTGENILAADIAIAALDLDASATDLLASPAVDTRLAVTSVTADDLALESVQMALAGPLPRMGLTLATEGEFGDTPVSLGLDGQVDGEGPRLGLRLDRFDAAYAEETVSLGLPLTITSQGTRIDIKDLNLNLPRNGRLTGDVTKYGNGIKGMITLSDLDASLAKTFADAPIQSGTLDADAEFDTGRGPARITLNVDDIIFDGVDTAGEIDLTAEADWDGRIATASGAIKGGFGEPFTFSGSAPLRPGLVPTLPNSGPVEGQVDWEGQIGNLWALIPAAGHLLDGKVLIDLGISGDLSKPQINGGLSLSEGGYQNLDIGTIITDLNLQTEITPEGALSFELDGKDGGAGALTTKGTVALDQSGIDIQTVIDKAVLVRRDDVTARIDADIRVAGPATGLAVDGDVKLETVEVRLVSSASAGIVDLGEVKIKGAPEVEEDAGESSVTLNLDITSPGRVFVRGRGLDSSWGVDLAVRGTAEEPRVTGRVERVRGTLELIGKTFDLATGRIDFDAGKKIDPRLDIVFERETQDLTGRILVTGKASEPKLNFSSSPSLPEDEVLPRTIFGKSSQSLTGSQAIQLALGVATLLDGGGGTLDKLRGAV
ncbi:MAG: translocation/assembly module TamB domain-containing protein, partial [Pseudomonadota bacterium]